MFGGAYYRRYFCVSDLGASIRKGLYMKGLIFGILRYHPTYEYIVYLLTEWKGRMGTYLARGRDARTGCSEIRASWPRAKYVPFRPDLNHLSQYAFYHMTTD